MKVVRCLPLLLLALWGCLTEGGAALYPVLAGENYGYINGQGQTIIEPQFIFASPFSQGYALVLFQKDSQAALIDVNGQIYRPPAGVEKLDLPHGGLARSVLDGKVGYLELPENKWKIKPQWRTAGRFSEGLAAVLLDDENGGYIDTNGELVFRLQAKALGRFHQRRAWFVRDGRFGIINEQGRVVVEPNYTWIGDYVDGLARTRTEDGLYGYLNLKGGWQIEPRHSRAEDFSERLALAFFDELGFYGYIDPTGEMVIPAIYDNGGPFRNGRAWVLDHGFYHYINAQGEALGSRTLLEADNFNGELARSRDEEGYFYLDRNANEVWRRNQQLNSTTASSDAEA